MISATVAALAIFTRSAPALVLVSVVYGLIFPWGLPWRSQVRNWAGARAAILGSILMSATIGVLGFAGVSTLDSSCVAVLAAPLFIACGCVGSNFQPEMTETTTTTKAPNGAWVMDATTVSSPNGARGALHTFLGLPCEGQKIVVTPGIGRDPRDSFRLSAEAWASGLTIVAVGRLRAEALVDEHGIQPHAPAMGLHHVDKPEGQRQRSQEAFPAGERSRGPSHSGVLVHDLQVEAAGAARITVIEVKYAPQQVVVSPPSNELAELSDGASA